METIKLAPGCTVLAETERLLYANGESGDRRVTLCVAERVGANGGEEPYLQTNGGPRLITPDGAGMHCTSIANAAAALDIEPEELRALVKDELPEIDW